MTKRREFTRTVRAQIVKRALDQKLGIICEGCGLVLGRRPFEIHHTTPDAMEIDKSRKLTAEDGQLLGVECCHKPQTKIDVKNIARAKRREAKHLGFQSKSRGFQKPPGMKFNWQRGRYERASE